MKYTCKLCQQIISTSKDGIEKAEKRNWECLNCYSVIAKKKYPKINRSNTVFSNMGLGLGDQVLAKNLVMFYQEDNPSENITVLKKSLSVQQVKTYLRASKYFFSDVNDHNLESIPKGKIVYYFKLTNEIKNFFAQGRELKLWFKSIKPQLTTKERIILEQKKAVIVHARFIDKNDNGNETSIKKNMSAEHFQKIIDTILEMKKIPVLVGNDKEIPETKTNKNVIDFRNKLMLFQFYNSPIKTYFKEKIIMSACLFQFYNSPIKTWRA